jgi:hypothetical protein
LSQIHYSPPFFLHFFVSVKLKIQANSGESENLLAFLSIIAIIIPNAPIGTTYPKTKIASSIYFLLEKRIIIKPQTPKKTAPPKPIQVISKNNKCQSRKDKYFRQISIICQSSRTAAGGAFFSVMVVVKKQVSVSVAIAAFVPGSAGY